MTNRLMVDTPRNLCSGNVRHPRLPTNLTPFFITQKRRFRLPTYGSGTAELVYDTLHYSFRSKKVSFC